MWRIIDISGDGYHVTVKNKNLSVLKDGEEKLHACFDDISCIVCHGNQLTYTNSALQAFMEHKIPVVFCDKTHTPKGMLMPAFCNNEYGGRIDIQINASQPLKKQAWRQVITKKLEHQSLCLLQIPRYTEGQHIYNLSKQVKSGDAGNREAIGARIYFSAVFDGFIRNANGDDILNSALNYGYAVLRSSVARSIAACGLNPALSIFHSNRHNPFALADDLMEPLRPLADWQVRSNQSLFSADKDLTPVLKKTLAEITGKKLYFKNEEFSFAPALQKYVISYFNYLKKETEFIEIPEIFKQ